MKSALAALIKLAMDANYSDGEIADLLLEASRAIRAGNWFGWSSK